MDDVRLIDANALLKEINEEIEECQPETTPGNKFVSLGLKAARKIIHRTPTISAQPVKRGRWIPSIRNAEQEEVAKDLGIDIEDFLSKAAYCSCCGIQFLTNGQDNIRKALIHKAVYKFCPNCGADMRGDDNA